MNLVRLVKEMAPGAITHTDRDTYVFRLDGEDHAHATFIGAANALGKELGIGKRHVPTEEVQRRVARIPQHDSIREPWETTPARRGRRSVKGQRAIRIELPQTVVGELLRSGRAKVILSLR